MDEVRQDIAESKKSEDEMRAKTPSLLMQKIEGRYQMR